jgi:hypothetical protein
MGDRKLKSKILQGAFTATFFRSNDVPPIYHAIITKQGSRQIISWTQCTTPEECERNAIEMMHTLNGVTSSNLLLFPPMTQSQFKRLGKRKGNRKQAQRA